MGLVVNGERIEDRLILQEAENLRPDYTKAFQEMENTARENQLTEWARENVIERTLLRQEAQRRDIQVTSAEVDAAIEQLKERCENTQTLYRQMNCDSEADLRRVMEGSIKVGKLAAQIRKGLPAPSQEQIKRYYQEHTQEFLIPELVRCAHIIKQMQGSGSETRTMAILQQARAELDQGSPFGRIVEKYSDAPENGGHLGVVARGQLVEEFADIVFQLNPGEFSQVFKTRFGYHIATVHERIPSRIADLKEARETIAAKLREQGETDAFYAFVDDLKSKAAIDEA